MLNSNSASLYNAVFIGLEENIKNLITAFKGPTLIALGTRQFIYFQPLAYAFYIEMISLQSISAHILIAMVPRLSCSWPAKLCSPHPRLLSSQPDVHHREFN